MVFGLCLFVLVWLFNRREKAVALPVAKIHSAVNTKPFSLTEKSDGKSCTPSKGVLFSIDRKNNKTQSEDNAKKKAKTVDQYTQTGEETTIWKGIWVDDATDHNNEVTNRHKTELYLDFSSGKVTRTEEVQRVHHTHIIAPL